MNTHFSDGTLSPCSPVKLGQIFGKSKLLSPDYIRIGRNGIRINEDIPLEDPRQKSFSNMRETFGITQTTSLKESIHEMDENKK